MSRLQCNLPLASTSRSMEVEPSCRIHQPRPASAHKKDAWRSVLLQRSLHPRALEAMAENDPALSSTQLEELLTADLRDVVYVREALDRSPESQVDQL